VLDEHSWLDVVLGCVYRLAVVVLGVLVIGVRDGFLFVFYVLLVVCGEVGFAWYCGLLVWFGCVVVVYCVYLSCLCWVEFVVTVFHFVLVWEWWLLCVLKCFIVLGWCVGSSKGLSFGIAKCVFSGLLGWFTM